jgi:hypothetical protein
MAKANTGSTLIPSRRAVLAGIATAPALAASALALSGPDPIFAAIENHRKCDADFIEQCNLEAAAEETGVKFAAASEEDRRTPEMIDAVDASIEARESLAKTAPTTLAGLVAYLDYVRDWSPDDELLFADDREGMDFLESLQRAVRGLNAGAVS